MDEGERPTRSRGFRPRRACPLRCSRRPRPDRRAGRRPAATCRPRVRRRRAPAPDTRAGAGAASFEGRGPRSLELPFRSTRRSRRSGQRRAARGRSVARRAGMDSRLSPDGWRERSPASGARPNVRSAIGATAASLNPSSSRTWTLGSAARSSRRSWPAVGSPSRTVTRSARGRPSMRATRYASQRSDVRSAHCASSTSMSRGCRDARLAVNQ